MMNTLGILLDIENIILKKKVCIVWSSAIIGNYFISKLHTVYW